MALLEVRSLRTEIKAREGTARVVNGVSFTLEPGQVLGVVGESGCGKTSLALSILGLLSHNGKVTGGEVLYKGEDLLKLKGARLNAIRGKEVAMVFQDANASLDPLFTVGAQIDEVLTTHAHMKKSEARAESIEALRRVGVAHPESMMDRYAFQLSGGQRQRATLAMAMVMHPRVLIADEPTSEQDLIVQADILVQLKQIREEEQTAILLISHDLGVIAQMAERVIVMYAGYVVEQGETKTVFSRPLHPYTYALVRSMPSLDEKVRMLPALPGKPPDMTTLGTGCPFLARCNKAMAACRTKPMPALQELEPGHMLACYNPIKHEW